MSNVITLTETNFESEVLDSDLPVLVEYWAPWCGPCRALAPVLEAIAEERAGQLKVGKVNIDDELALARQADVLSIPYLVLYRDGTPATKVAGVLPRTALERFLRLDGARATVRQ